MKGRSLRHDSSGQVIIVSALLIALLLLSAAVYVMETEKNTPIIETTEPNFSAYKQNVKNTLISALANVTNGGDPSVLTTDLKQLMSAITAQSYRAMLQINIAPLNVAPYQNGFWISWGTNGQGVSSVSTSYVFTSSGSTTSSELGSAMNVTSAVDLSGSYLKLDGNFKQVNLKVNLLNEGKPALVQSLTVYFSPDGYSQDWVNVGLQSIIDFGNGTYAISVNSRTNQPNDPVLVSVHCQDERGILTIANVTCTSVG